MTITRADGAWIHPSIVFGGTAHIGFSSCIGYGPLGDIPTHIGDGIRVGAFCVIEHGVHIDADVEIDHYCRIAQGTYIGTKTKILYGAQVFDNVKIGRDCIIAGHLVDRTIVADEVTFQGNTAHSHRDATGDWDETEEPSPTIERGSVVGIGALLVGGIMVGPRAYVAAGEIVKCNVPAETVLRGGRLRPLSDFRGLIKVRGS
jgi:acetyltransferase-like isoleucine patch superfamily enzyme